MSKYVVLHKKNLDDFIKKLANQEKVVAPVAKGYDNFSFQEIKNSHEIAFTYIPTILPPKKYFFPQYEALAEYNRREKTWNAVIEYEKMTIFGVHTCDLAGIQCLNMVFSDKPKDINYIVRKNKITIIGLECNNYCDEYASCCIVDNHLPNGGYDLFFTDLGDYFIVHVNTLIGEEIVEKTGTFEDASKNHQDTLQQMRDKKRDIFKNEVNAAHNELKMIFEKSARSQVWKDLDKRCVGCNNCTNVCPTCYCFDMEDDISLDLTTGIKKRRWDSCQSESFTRIAGGENFRKTKGEKQRHRYMRKFNYPVDKYRRYFCTGCGRCSRTCMAKIKLKETINSLAAEVK